MKKFFVALMFVMLLTACGNRTTNTCDAPAADSTAVEVVDSTVVAADSTAVVAVDSTVVAE